ncbi:tyramine beta-hydroxylase [Anopheles maculipalpis]|uniref:tyramine beta-hydroxylase n=1 Tax=Anopheles maculipalpis TaxID=1496333 RepID=UPI0021593120|nr:tyramine beta-hydroxylase [Anopheles maculipalpis]
MVNWRENEVFLHVNSTFEHGKFQTFAIGFSQRGQLSRTDLCVFSFVPNLLKHAYDTYTSGDYKHLFIDTIQNCDTIYMDENSIAFRRKFDTCDPQDIVFHSGTMYLVWWRIDALLDWRSNVTMMPNISAQNQGVLPLQLLRADKIHINEEPQYLNKIEVHLENVVVPAVETTYWCKIQQLEPWLINTKHHIIQFEPIIDNEDLVHHMEVFQCIANKTEISTFNGPCNDMPTYGRLCSKVMALWAMGAGSFTYPKEAGLPVGGKEFNSHIRLEVHFNNPNLKSGIIDSSGMRINLISKLRRYDAAIMELGLEYTDKMAIPPGQIAFPLYGYCIAECTKLALPKTGITIFGSQLHTHLRGVRVLTRHLRGKEELPVINRDDFFSHHYQEIRQLRYKPEVLPGDALVTTCYYDTRGYKLPTLGGFSISDEMCVNYIHYYPATELEVCKSSISDNSLYNFFEYMKKVQGQNISSATGPRSKNYLSIHWNQKRTNKLLETYLSTPLSMQCNRSNGMRFDGFHWEDAPITTLKLPIRESRSCSSQPNNLQWFKPLNHGLCDSFGECIYAEAKVEE